MFSLLPLQLFHSVLDGYGSVSATCLSLLGARGRGLSSWLPASTMTGPSNTVSSLMFHATFAVLRLVFLWLIISVLLRNYRRARAELYRPAVDLQDYEMVELFVRRLKMWMGLSRTKEVSLLFMGFWPVSDQDTPHPVRQDGEFISVFTSTSFRLTDLGKSASSAMI